MHEMTAIYALCESDTTDRSLPWVPRYVGKTVQYLHERHKAHIRGAKRGKRLPVHYWLRKQIETDADLAIKLLEYVPTSEDWAARERFWINKLRNDGHNLLNLTSGGEGLPGHKFSKEHRAKISDALKTGAYFNCETCGKEFWRKQYAIKHGQTRFCSRKCSNHRHLGRDLFNE